MNDIRPKVEHLRLDPIAYENLRQQVLRRDGWHCQACGAMSHLEVHHREFRSHCGDDSELNLITLCTACHAQTHRESNFNPARGTKSLQTQSEWLEG
jgi:5-methylcytosine-specific restriction endonuclease McrA